MRSKYAFTSGVTVVTAALAVIGVMALVISMALMTGYRRDLQRKLLGGTCVNNGCTPTKAMVASAYAAHLARRGAEYGVNVGPVTVDIAKARGRATEVTLDSSVFRVPMRP